MLLYLINPANALVSITKLKENRWNKYRIWKPLGLLVIAGATPPEWEIKIIDENRRKTDYSSLRRPDLVGITAFTSQANRAYEISAYYRNIGVPVVMGGIHATMCLEEALANVDAVVTREAEDIWREVLEDVRHKRLKRVYEGGYADMGKIPMARHDLVAGDYSIGSIQTARGCPLNCSFCSVTAFNGRGYRARPIDEVIREFKTITEKHVLVVDDNLVGTSKAHIARAKELFRGIIKAKIKKNWFGQVTINMADDDELLSLAAKSGCLGLFIGFESTNPEGLAEVNKKFNSLNHRNMRDSVWRIRKHGILVVGSFIMGLDNDRTGIGREIADTAHSYGVDFLNLLLLTPLPGTRLFNEMKSGGRIPRGNFPSDWKYYTLTFPVAKYKNFSWPELVAENRTCFRRFYSIRRVASRIMQNIFHVRHPFWTAVSNITIISNAIRFHRKAYNGFDFSRGETSVKQNPHEIQSDTAQHIHERESAQVRI